MFFHYGHPRYGVMGLLKYVLRARQSALGWAARAKSRVALKKKSPRGDAVVTEVEDEAALAAISYFQQGDASLNTADTTHCDPSLSP